MNTSPFFRSMLPAGSNTGTSPGHDCSHFPLLTVFLIGTGTIAAGTVIVEEAHYEEKNGEYTGTWAAITTLNAADVTGGKQQSYHIGGPGGSFTYRWVRCRIGTAVSGGGSVEAVLAGSSNG